MSNHEAVTIDALHTGPLRLKRGEEVMIAGRGGAGPRIATFVRMERIPSHWRKGEFIYYMRLKGEGLLTPLEDVIEVVSR